MTSISSEDTSGPPSVTEQALELRLVMVGSGAYGPPLPAGGISVCLIDAPDSSIDLPALLGSQSPISEFLNGDPPEGQHHVCFEVSDIVQARLWFKNRGIGFLSVTRIGRLGTLGFCLLPKNTGGILVEIMEAQGRAGRGA